MRRKEKIQKTEKGYDICIGCDDGALGGGPNVRKGDEIEYDLDTHKPTTDHRYDYKIDDSE